MITIYTRKTSEFWKARYYNRYCQKQEVTLRHFPKDTATRDEVYAEVMQTAGHEYFMFLHSRGEWSRLAARLYDLKRMYTRMSDYQPLYTIHEFEHDLKEVGVTPAPTKEAKAQRRRVIATAKRIRRKRNVRHMYKGKARTVNELASLCDIPTKALRMRINRGWSVEDAMTKPLMTGSEAGHVGANRRWMKEKS